MLLFFFYFFYTHPHARAKKNHYYIQIKFGMGDDRYGKEYKVQVDLITIVAHYLFTFGHGSGYFYYIKSSV